MIKIAILGAGAMGSLFGGRLAEAGHAVTLLDINDAHLDAIRRFGLRLQTDEADRRVHGMRAVRPEQAHAIPDLLIVFTKSMHTRAAMAGVRHLLGPGTNVLTLQNGLGSVEAIGEFVPAQRLLIGVTTWPADLVGPGHVHSHGEGGTRMMSADGVDRPAVAGTVAALERAGLHCTADADVWAAIWEKVAFNAALNPLCAVTGSTVDQLGSIPDGPALAFCVVAEVLAVARRHGVAVDADKVGANVLHAIGHHIGHKPSMLQDILAARRTEIDAINGAVVAAARRHGVPVPCTESLLQLVRLIEARAASGGQGASPLRQH
ncbi:2-dehydropantoate 2-reductase [Cupriavidus sp. 8B]